MGRLIIAIVFLLGAPLPALAVQPEPGAPGTKPLYVPDQVVVRYRADAPETDVRKLLHGKALARKRLMTRAPVEVLKLEPGLRVPDMVRRLEASGLVEYAEPNYYRFPLEACGDSANQVCPNDPEFNRQYPLHNDNDADMDMPEAWDILTGAPDIRVAVIDDGFDLDHVDLQANFKNNNGGSCTSSGCSGSAASQNSNESHGTAVTGVMAAVGNNATGITGALWDAQVYPIRIDFTSAGIAQAIDHAVANNARIINLSLGGPAYTNVEFDALERAEVAGVLVVAAAGNEDSNTDKSIANYPANYPLPNIISAAASTAGDNIAFFSTWGSVQVDVAAAGFSVRSAGLNDTYLNISGTSFSSPYTAGVAALIAQHLCDERAGGGFGACTDPGTTVGYEDIRAYLLGGAETVNDSTPNGTGLRGRSRAGRVNAKNSLDFVDTDSTEAPTTPLLSGLIVNDSASGDNDGYPDPGESFDLKIRLEVLGAAPTSLTGTLTVENGDLALFAPTGDVTVDTSEQNFEIDPDPNSDEYVAQFPVSLTNFTDNRQYLFRLDLDVDGTPISRYFYFEVGALTNAQGIPQTFQRSNWDEFHAFHVTVPAGASSLVIETGTQNDTDIDLLAREALPPEYLITLGVDPEGGGQIFFAGAEGTDNNPANQGTAPAHVSGRFDGEEVIVVDTPAEGLYHLVTLNYALSMHDYTVKATVDATRHRLVSSGLDDINFQDVGLVSVNEGNTLMLQVERVGPTDRATSIAYRTRSATADNVSYVQNTFSLNGLSAAASGDYQSKSGSLSWAAGETGAKTIEIPISSDSVNDNNEIFRVELHDPGSADNKATRGLPFDAFVVINNVAPPSSGGGGGGVSGPLCLLALTLVALGYRVARHRNRAG